MRFRTTKGTVFTLLLLLAGVLSVLPGSCTHWLRSPFQVLALPQWVLLRSAQRAIDGAAADEAEPLAKLQQENEELRLALGQQRLWLQDLERRYDAICGIRGQLWSDRVELVVAKVLTFDASPWRETLLINRGADSRLQPGQWVIAGPGLEEWNSGAEFALQRCLIGRISEVQTHVSRVELISDSKFREPVAPIKVLADGTWQVDPRRFVITGRGQRRLQIRDADSDLAKLGFRFVAVPPGPNLPATLSLGRITRSQQSAQSALHFDVDVEPLVDPGRLRYVAIFVEPP